jgi:hypothetical protein
LSKANYQIDALQKELLKWYLRADLRFRRAFSFDATPYFLKFLYDKVRLREPYSLSCMGSTRGGKSYSMITLICLTNALYGKKTVIEHINGNQYEFLQKVQRYSQIRPQFLENSAFLNDEDKFSVFGAGSFTKKVKLQDVQNIIAMNNISTISICPVKLTGSHSNYGIRCWGRCFNTKTVRFMLYNTQESEGNSVLPMGMLYLPIFPEVVPYWKELEQAYLLRKKEWIEKEALGESDVLMKLKKRSAVIFSRDPKFLQLKKKDDKMTYIGVKLGSEWGNNEKTEILSIIDMLQKGVLDSEDIDKEMEEERAREEYLDS